MKRLMRSVTVVAGGVVALSGAAAAAGDAHVVIPFDLEAGEVAEGVAADLEGNVFTGISSQGRFLKLMEGSDEAETFFMLPGLEEGDFGLTGMAVNGDRDQYMHGLYAAVVSLNPALNGVHVLDPFGRSDPGNEWRHIEGTERMAMANAIAFDESADHMYVSDSAAGQVWRLKLYGFVGYAEPEVWMADPLLEGTGALPFPFPVGANGIAVHDDVVYVGVTEQGHIVGVPIEADGVAGEPFVHLDLEGVAIDGIAITEDGEFVIADPPANTIWIVGEDGVPMVLAGETEAISGPTSVAIGSGPDGETVYVANMAQAVVGDLAKHPPSIVAIELD